MSNPDEAKQFLLMRMRDYGKEVFACLFLDTKNRVIEFEELFVGSLHSAEVHPREVVKQALKYNANAVILAHNHPSGDCKAEPVGYSEITHTLRDALSLMDIKVLRPLNNWRRRSFISGIRPVVIFKYYIRYKKLAHNLSYAGFLIL